MKLSDVGVGAEARVVRIEGTDAIAMRLMEMGLVPGCCVSLLGTALLGDPLEIQVRGYRLSLRRAEAARVEVTATDAPA